MSRTPIAVFLYRRPDHARAMLASLAACARIDECDVHLFCDGAKDSTDAAAVAETRAVVRDWAEKNPATIIERTENLGLAGSIVSAVTALVERHGRVIVVEDDLVLSPDFLRFVLAGLDRYEHDARVLQISGFAFATEVSRPDDAIFLPLSSTWGWATWSRAWSHFRAQPDDIKALEDDAVRDRFDLGGSYPYSTLLAARLAARNQSWGVLWYWAVFRAGGLVLYPRESLVHVGGNDGTGTHCTAESADAGRQIPGKIRDARALAWPAEVACDEEIWRAVKRDLRQRGAENSPKPKWRAWLESRLQTVP